MSPALAAYLAASALAGPVATPLLRRRLARGKEDGGRLGERLGRAGRARPDGRLAWLHAASVGEANSALPLVAALRARGLSVLVTTGTVTSARQMVAVLPEGAIHQFAPVDTAPAVRGFLDHWRPDLAVWIESELWPRLVVETARRGIPMALVNARLSARSAERWGWLPGMARALLGGFRLVLAQDRETVGRLRALGVEARFAGNLKALVTVPDCAAAELAAIRAALGGRPVWLAASTHDGEERAVIAAHKSLRVTVPRASPPPPVGREGDDAGMGGDACEAASRPDGGLPSPPAFPPRPGEGQGGGATMDATTSGAGGRSPASDAAPLLILAPRHPARGDAVAALLADAGLTCVRRSAGGLPGAADVWLADTLGEMGLWYRLAPLAFVGGSLVPVGGHTPFEPVQLRSAVLHGPHVANFAPAYAALDAGGGAVPVADSGALAAAVRGLFADPGRAEALREQARAIHDGLKPDLAAVTDGLLALMEAA